MRSSDAVRLARHADRFGRAAFPEFSEDEVVQWLVEEALMAKLDKHDRDADAAAHREQAVDAAQRRVREQLDQAHRSGR